MPIDQPSAATWCTPPAKWCSRGESRRSQADQPGPRARSKTVSAERLSTRAASAARDASGRPERSITGSPADNSTSPGGTTRWSGVPSTSR
jgi:hypothetical protein